MDPTREFSSNGFRNSCTYSMESASQYGRAFSSQSGLSLGKIAKFGLLLFGMLPGVGAATDVKSDAFSVHLITDEIVPTVKREFPEGTVFAQSKLSDQIDKIVACPTTKVLLEASLKKGDLVALFGDDSPLQAPSGGSWRASFRTILVNHKESAVRQLGHLTFEITNSLMAERQLSLSDRAALGEVSKYDYIHEWESIEYETAKTFYHAVQPCIRDGIMPKGTDMDIRALFKGGKKAIGYTFESFWNVIKDTGHAATFGNDWDRGFRKLYCKKHPKAADCVKSF